MDTASTPFGPMRRAYARRLAVAALCTVVATGGARALALGLVSAEHWVVVLMATCVTGAIALVLGFDLTQRWWNLRQLGVVENAAKPYGIAGNVPPAQAANDLGARTRH